MGLSWSGLNSIRDKLDAKVAAMEEKFREAVDGVKDGIKIRTQAGFDVESNLFRDYSKSWAKKRRAAGKGIDRVDLTFSGAMFKSLSVRFEKQTYLLSATIYFSSPEQAQKAKWNHVDHKRPFFSLSAEQKRSIINQVRSAG